MCIGVTRQQGLVQSAPFVCVDVHNACAYMYRDFHVHDLCTFLYVLVFPIICEYANKIFCRTFIRGCIIVIIFVHACTHGFRIHTHQLYVKYHTQLSRFDRIQMFRAYVCILTYNTYARMVMCLYNCSCHDAWAKLTSITHLRKECSEPYGTCLRVYTFVQEYACCVISASFDTYSPGFVCTQKITYY